VLTQQYVHRIAAMEEALENDVGSVAAVFNTPAMDSIVVYLYHLQGGEPKALKVSPNDAMLQTMQRTLNARHVLCWLGGDEIADTEATFADWGAEDGARFTVDTPAGLNLQVGPPTPAHLSPKLTTNPLTVFGGLAGCGG
jgi:hypothetical protein